MEYGGFLETLHTSVRSDSLDFRGTPLEHRYNPCTQRRILKRLDMDKVGCYIHRLGRLAYRDRILWEGGMTFVPFKRSTPVNHGSVDEDRYP